MERLYVSLGLFLFMECILFIGVEWFWWVNGYTQ